MRVGVQRRELPPLPRRPLRLLAPSAPSRCARRPPRGGLRHRQGGGEGGGGGLAVPWRAPEHACVVRQSPDVRLEPVRLEAGLHAEGQLPQPPLQLRQLALRVGDAAELASAGPMLSLSRAVGSGPYCRTAPRRSTPLYGCSTRGILLASSCSSSATGRSLAIDRSKVVTALSNSTVGLLPTVAAAMTR